MTHSIQCGLGTSSVKKEDEHENVEGNEQVNNHRRAAGRKSLFLQAWRGSNDTFTRHLASAWKTI
jgi:hypothetical protein